MRRQGLILKWGGGGGGGEYNGLWSERGSEPYKREVWRAWLRICTDLSESSLIDSGITRTPCADSSIHLFTK